MCGWKVKVRKSNTDINVVYSQENWKEGGRVKWNGAGKIKKKKVFFVHSCIGVAPYTFFSFLAPEEIPINKPCGLLGPISDQQGTNDGVDNRGKHSIFTVVRP